MFLQNILSRSRRAAAVLDVLEAGSGLALAVFLWLHMIFVASIFYGPEVFDRVANFLDSYYISYAGIPPLIFIFLMHSLLAARKIPATFREQRIIWKHAGLIRHKDTWTWIFQVASGMAILILASIHFWEVLSDWPIEAAMSAFLVKRTPYLVFYIFLLLFGQLHAGFGLYRLAVKWGWPPRHMAESIFELISVFIILLGLSALVVLRTVEGGF